MVGSIGLRHPQAFCQITYTDRLSDLLLGQEFQKAKSEWIRKCLKYPRQFLFCFHPILPFVQRFSEWSGTRLRSHPPDTAKGSWLGKTFAPRSASLSIAPRASIRSEYIPIEILLAIWLALKTASPARANSLASVLTYTA